MESKKRKKSSDKTDSEILKLEQESLKTKKRLLPKKADFRMRAHVNPLKDTAFPQFIPPDFLIKKMYFSPINPDFVDWSIHYPKFFGGTDEENQRLFLNSIKEKKMILRIF